MVAFRCSALNHSTVLISVEFATIFPVLPLVPAVFVSLNRDLLVRRPSASYPKFTDSTAILCWANVPLFRIIPISRLAPSHLWVQNPSSANRPAMS